MFRITAFLGSASLLSGCIYLGAELSTVEGDSYANNKEAMIVTDVVSDEPPVMDAHRSDMAIYRYKTDTIKEPESGSGAGELKTSEEDGGN
ncbi:MAG: hypothetical protein HKN14_11250 [Marinicaulis sp.]|nr:hypothetical protein [Marinicaulis sp.]